MSDPIAFYRWAQQRLVAHGADIGVDGMWGTASRKATIFFQVGRSLAASGKLDAATVAALRQEPAGGDSGPAGAVAHAPYRAELERRRGLHEVRDRSALMAWLRSDGKTLGDPAVLPWCGDAIQTAIALTLPDEPLPANPYWAKNWLSFGIKCGAIEDAVGVFDRPGGGGHVAILVGQTSTHYELLGGNQRNAIIVAALKKDRLLGFRRPKTFDLNMRAVNRVANAVTVSTNEA